MQAPKKSPTQAINLCCFFVTFQCCVFAMSCTTAVAIRCSVCSHHLLKLFIAVPTATCSLNFAQDFSLVSTFQTILLPRIELCCSGTFCDFGHLKCQVGFHNLIFSDIDILYYIISVIYIIAA